MSYPTPPEKGEKASPLLGKDTKTFLIHYQKWSATHHANETFIAVPTGKLPF